MSYNYAAPNLSQVRSNITSAASNISNKTSGFGTKVSDFFQAATLGSFKYIALLILVIFVLLVIYHKTVGYYINIGWNRMRNMWGNKESVDIDIDPGETGTPALSATIAPMAHDAPPTNPMLPPDDRPSGMPGSRTPSLNLFGELEGAMPHSKEVFNISRNIYTFHDAAAVCAAAGGELASYDQVKEAYDKGADWCNYGWIKGQMAVYPTQKETYQKLQKGAPEFQNACGKPGVNGGHFDNPELRFGVNCYGVKPTKKASDELLESQVALPSSPAEIEFDKQVQKFREQMDNATILPFHKGKWSE